jgi:hypothetical protein
MGRFFSVALVAAAVLASCVTQQPVSEDVWTPTLATTSRESPRIVGGDTAKAGDWPYFADLSRMVDGNEEHFCGGTVIARRWVLTAAHCFDADDIQEINGAWIWKQNPGLGRPRVQIGTIDLNNPTGGSKQFEVADVLIHPDYTPLRNAGQQTIGPSRDLALVRLSASWDRPVARLSAGGPSDSDAIGARGFVAGFGLKQDYSRLGEVPKIATIRGRYERRAGSSVLLHAMLPMKTRQDCTAKYLQYGYDGGLQICAGRKEGRVDSCTGDSGGPLVGIDNQGRAYQVGVVSYGFVCGEAQSEGVYTRISALRPWIEANVPDAKFVAAEPETALVAASETFEAMTRVLQPTTDRMKLSVAPTNVAPNASMRIDIESSVSGRLIVFELMNNGKIALMFPNDLSQAKAEFIEAGKAVSIPATGDTYRLPATPGGGTIYAMVLPRSVQFVGDLMPTQQRIAAAGEQPESKPVDYATRLLEQVKSQSDRAGLASWAAQKKAYRTVSRVVQ